MAEILLNATIAGQESADQPISPEQTIPDLLRAWPHLRLVLDKYGLKGCGGPLGPVETLSFFARAHGVDLHALLNEMHAARRQTQAGPPAYRPGPGDTIYRLFFKGGIAVVLSAGAVWGALLLLRIGYAQDFAANSIFAVNAHGHAMIFGWVGLFVMGFAYQAFPRFKHTELQRPRLAVASFWLMSTGIALRVVCETLHASNALFFSGAFVACALEFTAIVLFIHLLLATFRRSPKPLEAYDTYILAALIFFVLQTVWDAALLWATTTAPTSEVLVARVAAYQAPLRDLQIHGFATFMILGVSMRYLPAIYGFAQPNLKLVRWICLPLGLAVLAEVVFFSLRSRGDARIWSGVGLYLSMLAFAGLVATLVLNMKVFTSRVEPDRSVKFLRTAFGWLLLSLTMLVAMPLYLRWFRGAHDSTFSHAYYGAMRHAITVGFITLMILGVASKVVPTLAGVSPARLTSLWPTFLLVNTGCLMRVLFQVLTDVGALSAFAFPVAGISGVLEVAGIALWGVHLWRVMNGAGQEHEAEVSGAVTPALRIDAEAKVGSVVSLFPKTLDVFASHGFGLLTNPYLRNTLARNISIAQACEIRKVDLNVLLRDLNLAAFPDTPVATDGASPEKASRPSACGHA
ncbi:MAG: DUF1858 domain-containing protein [Planctomycetota bacterium]|nr:DUF1858 domain-containing protein [Planctomycetota bacterium]